MRLGIVLALLGGACSFHTNAGAPVDARDAGPGSDAQVLGRQQMEVVAGAGRVTHGTLTIDVEVGHAVLVRKSTAGTITVTGAQVVKP